VAYWRRTGAHTYEPTEHVGGAWDLQTQHIAPLLGLLAHEVEVDRDRRRSDGLLISRLSYDILGPLPLEEVETAVTVTRPGRSIELVEAVASQGGRPATVLRAWLLEPRDTGTLAATDLARIAPPEEMKPFEACELWPGGFIASLEIRRDLLAPGRGACWVRTPHPLVAEEEVSRFATVAGILDVTNGMAVRAEPAEVAFPNVDLTAHFFQQPADGWLGLDIDVSFGANGLGLTSSVIHDESGPIGTVAQTLTVRP
jgi:hypothetical protein